MAKNMQPILKDVRRWESALPLWASTKETDGTRSREEESRANMPSS